MIVLSIDSGVERTGYSLFQRRDSSKEIKYITSGLITTSKKNVFEKRLLKICDFIEELIKTHKPDTLVLEQLFFFKNEKTVIAVSQMQGAVTLTAAKKHIPIVYLTPLQVKQTITGYGHADKKAIQKMIPLLIKLPKTITQDDEADAVAIGLAYCSTQHNLI